MAKLIIEKTIFSARAAFGSLFLLFTSQTRIALAPEARSPSTSWRGLASSDRTWSQKGSWRSSMVAMILATVFERSFIRPGRVCCLNFFMNSVLPSTDFKFQPITGLYLSAHNYGKDVSDNLQALPEVGGEESL